MTETSEWPECQRQSSLACEGEVDPRRIALGLPWCLACADGRKEYCAVPMHKSNTVLVTDIKQLKYIGVQTPREQE
jgi:hypothetical protein